jgi:hypothetical protein
MSHDVDKVLEKLAKDVEAAVHALYRGEMRQETARVRTGHLVSAAKTALTAAMSASSAAVASPVAPPVAAAADNAIPQLAPKMVPRISSPRPSVSAPTVAGENLGWTKDESDAVLRCISAWLPMGGPNSTAPETKCIAAGKVLVPTWGERSRALDAVRRISAP